MDPQSSDRPITQFHRGREHSRYMNQRALASRTIHTTRVPNLGHLKGILVSLAAHGVLSWKVVADVFRLIPALKEA